MWERGFVAEVGGLADRGLRAGRTASRALGLPAGAGRSWPGRSTRRRRRPPTVRATRRFARRQDSWFRRDPRISWLRYDRPDLVHVARTLLPGMEG